MYCFIKRSFDIFCGLILMLIFVITYPFVAIGIKLSSPGPIMYISTRIGKNGIPFKFYKYRSMHIDSGNFKGIAEEQKRIFWIGKLLRRSKIDELPQAINIIKGDLSIIGPRPMLPTNYMKIYGGRYAKVLTIKPGLTSYASLFDFTHGDARVGDRNFYTTTIVPIKQEMELYYVEKACVMTDISIFFKTVFTILAVIFGKKEFKYPKEYYIAKQNLDAITEK